MHLLSTLFELVVEINISMKYYTPSDFSYSPDDVLACLPQDDPGPIGMLSRSCTASERIQIEQVLNMGLPIKNILYFQLSGQSVGRIHTDVLRIRPSEGVRTAILIPLQRCEGVNMRWYKNHENKPPSGDDLYRLKAPSGWYATCVKPESVIFDEEVFCTKPIIAQVVDWHAISNDAPQVGRILSVRFHSDVTYEQLCERFGPA
jgi:hypothetical protein